MVDGRQTHRLPPPEERLGLARSMGYADVERFEAALTGHRERVAALFSGLLGTTPGAAPLDPELALLADQQVEPGRRREIALRRGFDDPEQAVAALDALARRQTPFSRMGDPAAAVALLVEVVATPDPGQAIAHLSEFAAALKAPEPYFRILRDSPRVLRQLVSLFGTSDFLSQRFLRHPELVDQLLRDDQVVLEKGLPVFRGEIAARLATVPPETPIDEAMERKLAELRRVKNEEVLRIAMHDIAGSIGLSSVAAQLSDPGRGAAPGRARAGRGGGAGQGADAPGPPDGDGARQARRARARVPLRPRPHLPLPGHRAGRDRRPRADAGPHPLRPPRRALPLVPADAAPRGAALQDRHAAPPRPGTRERWSRAIRASPATTSLRPTARRRAASSGSGRRCSGPAWPRGTRPSTRGSGATSSTRRSSAARSTARRSPPRCGACASGWRARFGKEASKGKNPKVGRGGIVDVEFAVQYLQLAHGHDHPAIRSPSTPVALRLAPRGRPAPRRRPTPRWPRATSSTGAWPRGCASSTTTGSTTSRPGGHALAPAGAAARLPRRGPGGAAPRRVRAGDRGGARRLRRGGGRVAPRGGFPSRPCAAMDESRPGRRPPWKSATT